MAFEFYYRGQILNTPLNSVLQQSNRVCMCADSGSAVLLTTTVGRRTDSQTGTKICQEQHVSKSQTWSFADL